MPQEQTIEAAQPQIEQLTLLDTVEMGIGKVEQLQGTTRSLRDSLEAELLQSDTYKDSKDKLRMIRAEHNLAKMRAMQNPICIELADKLDEVKEDLKIEKQSLSATLIYYAEETSSTQITKGDDTYQIIKSARVKKDRAAKGKGKN